MKRRLFKLALFLFLGAIVNVAVAWGISIFCKIEPASLLERRVTPTSVELDWLIALGWIPMPESEQWVYSSFTIDSNQSGISISWIGEQAKDNPLYNHIPSSFTPMWVFAATVRSGWPLRSQFGRVIDDSAIQQNYDRIGSMIGGSIFTGLPSLKSPVWIHSISYARPDEIRIHPSHRRMIPLHPIWPGFAINTIFYATIFWLLILVPFTARRMIRRKRGLCIKCSYDLRGNSGGEVCPECGCTIIDPTN